MSENEQKRDYTHLTMAVAMEMAPTELMQQLDNMCKVEMPRTVESIEDMKIASVALGECASLYSYLINMQMSAKVLKKQLKRDGNKTLMEDALVREEIFGNYAEMMKTTYNAVSRMVTIKQQINSELRMLGDNIG